MDLRRTVGYDTEYVYPTVLEHLDSTWRRNNVHTQAMVPHSSYGFTVIQATCPRRGEARGEALHACRATPRINPM